MDSERLRVVYGFPSGSTQAISATQPDNRVYGQRRCPFWVFSGSASFGFWAPCGQSKETIPEFTVLLA